MSPDRSGDATDAGTAAIDRLLTDAEVILVAGAGGVGKTTVTAALGLRAAQRHGRRVVVVTVDPARRLADALNVDRLTEAPVLVPVGEGRGRMWVVMVDMARSWDRLVDRHAPTAEVRRRLLANGLYRTLTRQFVQSHDYIALDHLCDLADEGRYDLVVVDTPPSRHAIDLLDAPGRMIEFFGSRLLRWLTLTAGAGLASVPARPFLLLADRVLGAQFLGQITSFFRLFAELQPAFVARAREVERRLADPTTTYVVVTTAERGPATEAGTLLSALRRRSLRPGMIVVNRFEPTLRLTDRRRPGRGAIAVRFDRDELAALEDDALRAAVEELQDRAERSTPGDWVLDGPIVALPWRAGDLDDLGGLAALLAGAVGPDDGPSSPGDH